MYSMCTAGSTESIASPWAIATLTDNQRNDTISKLLWTMPSQFLRNFFSMEKKLAINTGQIISKLKTNVCEPLPY